MLIRRWWSKIGKGIGLNSSYVDNIPVDSSGFRGGADASLPLRDSTPCRAKGSSLCTILKYPFSAD